MQVVVMVEGVEGVEGAGEALENIASKMPEVAFQNYRNLDCKFVKHITSLGIATPREYKDWVGTGEVFFYGFSYSYPDTFKTTV